MSLLDQVSAGRPARRSAGWRDDDRVHRRTNWIAGGALALVLAAAGGAMVFGARESVAAEREPKTGCLVHSAPPSATLAFLDVTDPLAADSGQRFTNLVTRMRDDLPRDGRLTIVPFGGDLGVSLAPVPWPRWDIRALCGANTSRAFAPRSEIMTFRCKSGTPMD